MRQFYTAVTERKQEVSGEFFTHPYEAGWASEAICFLRIEEHTGERLEVNAHVQISPDGIRWVDEGVKFPVIGEPGDYFVKVSHFGGWLRLRGLEKNQGSRAVITVWWILKE